jgi:hypothetical protein
MKKLNKFERYVLDQGLIMWQEEMLNHITTADNQGKRSVFAAEYPPMVVQEIKDKLDQYTTKQ